MAILITNGVKEEYAVHGDYLLSSWSGQDGDCGCTYSPLQQCNSPEPNTVVVRQYTNTPYIPQGTSRLFYLDVSTLSQGASSTQFPLDHLHLWKLLPYSKNEVLLPHKEGEIGYRPIPTDQRGPREMLWIGVPASPIKCPCQSPHLILSPI